MLDDTGENLTVSMEPPEFLSVSGLPMGGGASFLSASSTRPRDFSLSARGVMPDQVAEYFSLLRIVVREAPIFECETVRVRRLFQAVVGDLTQEVTSILQIGESKDAYLRTLHQQQPDVLNAASPESDNLWQIPADVLQFRIETCSKLAAKVRAAFLHTKTVAMNEDRKNPEDTHWNLTAASLFGPIDTLISRASTVYSLVIDHEHTEAVRDFLLPDLSAQSDNILRLCSDFHTFFMQKSTQIIDPLLATSDSALSAFGETSRKTKKSILRWYDNALREATNQGDFVAAVRTYETFEALFTDYPEMKTRVWDKYQAEYIQLAHQELIKINAEWSSGVPCVYNRYTPTVANVMWQRELLRRVEYLRNKMEIVDDDVLAGTQSQLCVHVGKRLFRGLKEAVEGSAGVWATQLPDLEAEFNTSVLSWSDADDHSLNVNFSSFLSQTVKDARFFSNLRKESAAAAESHGLSVDLPSEVLYLLQREQELHPTICRLREVTYMHNTLITSLESIEKFVFSAEIELVHAEIQTGVESLTWNTEELEEFVLALHRRADALSSAIGMLRDLRASLETVLAWPDCEAVLTFPSPTEGLAKDFSFTAYIHGRLSGRIEALRGKQAYIEEVIANSEDAVLECRKVFHGTTSDDETTQYFEDRILAYKEHLTDVITEILNTGILTSLCAMRDRLMVSPSDLPASNRRRSSASALQIAAFPLCVSFEHDSVLFGSDLVEADDLTAMMNSVFADVANEVIGTAHALVQPCNPQATFFNVISTRDDVRDVRAHMAQSVEDAVESVLESIEHSIELLGLRPVATLGSNFNLLCQNGLMFMDTELRTLNLDLEKLGRFVTTQFVQWVVVDFTSLRAALTERAQKTKDRLSRYIITCVQSAIEEHRAFVDRAIEDLNVKDAADEAAVQRALDATFQLENKKDDVFSQLELLRQALDVAHNHVEDVESLAQKRDIVQRLAEEYDDLFRQCKAVSDRFIQQRDQEAERSRNEVSSFLLRLSQTVNELKEHHLFTLEAARCADCDVYDELDKWRRGLSGITAEGEAIKVLIKKNRLPPNDFLDINWMHTTLRRQKEYWDLVHYYYSELGAWLEDEFLTMKLHFFNAFLEGVLHQLDTSDIQIRSWPTFKEFNKVVSAMFDLMATLEQLRTSHLETRHWRTLLGVTSTSKDEFNPDFTLHDVIVLLRTPDEVGAAQSLAVRALHEYDVENKLQKLTERCVVLRFVFVSWSRYQVDMLSEIDVLVDSVDDGILALQTLQANAFAEYFSREISRLLVQLNDVNRCMTAWSEVHRRWCVLYPIFEDAGSVRAAVPEEAALFAEVHKSYMRLIEEAKEVSLVVPVCSEQRFIAELEQLAHDIARCERALVHYLNVKRKSFPRFFLVSDNDLVEILSYGKETNLSLKHFSKAVECVLSVEISTEDEIKGIEDPLSASTPVFTKSKRPGRGFHSASVVEHSPTQHYELFSGFDTSPQSPGVISVQSEDKKSTTATTGGGGGPLFATALVALHGERLVLNKPCLCDENAEHTFATVLEGMQTSVCRFVRRGIDAMRVKGMHHVAFAEEDLPTQAAVVAHMVIFSGECTAALHANGAHSTEMRVLLDATMADVTALIEEGIQDRGQTPYMVARTMWLVTSLLRARDIMRSLMDSRAESDEAFPWMSQLRFFDQLSADPRTTLPVTMSLCDVTFTHQSEYIGMSGSLVSTPLTNRCFITLTQALRLHKGGGPCGPAGTGKTETIKELARHLGLMCYVFNCTNQMNYYTIGNVIQGLAMCGMWGCFDEFNRINVEVLSVVATQVRLLFNALRAGKADFSCLDDAVPLVSTVGVFITMNPGYLGRVELPSNLKTLFRPCPMVLCDSRNICEILFMAEGFSQAAHYGQKIVALFELCQTTLSKMAHYDWGLRAMKSLVRVAGQFLRTSPIGTPELTIILRALSYTTSSRLEERDYAPFDMIVQGLFPRDALTTVGPINDRSQDVTKRCRTAAAELGLSIVESTTYLIDRAAQFVQLIRASHALIVLGSAASGKSTTWRIARKTFEKSLCEIITPRTLSTNELFGFVHPTSHEWRDGVLSRVFRDFAARSLKNPMNMKWIALDGPIYPDWVESLNSVMDDTRTLILVSNERIQLHQSMRILLECSNLDSASPATVSRCSLMNVAHRDIGFYVEQSIWLRRISRYTDVHSVMRSLLEEIIPKLLSDFLPSVKRFLQTTDLALSRTFFRILSAMITPHLEADTLLAADCNKFFVLALHWTVSSVIASSAYDAWVDWLSVHCETSPELLTDTYYDTSDMVFRKFTDLTHPRIHVMKQQQSHGSDSGGADLLSSDLLESFLHTEQSLVVYNLLRALFKAGYPLQLCGPQGCGKTQLSLAVLSEFTRKDYTFRAVKLHHFSSGSDVESVLESVVERRGRTYSPLMPLILFVDDVGLPHVDRYGTQGTHEFLRIFLDLGFYYNHGQQLLKPVSNVSIFSTFNPNLGTNSSMCPRLQSHVSSMSMQRSLDTITLTKMMKSFTQLASVACKLNDDVEKRLLRLASTVVSQFDAFRKAFPYTASNFIFQWSVNDVKRMMTRIVTFWALNPRATDTIIMRCVESEFQQAFRNRLRSPEEGQRYDQLAMTLKKLVSADVGADYEGVVDPCIALFTGSTYNFLSEPPDWSYVSAHFAPMVSTFRLDHELSHGYTNFVPHPQTLDHVSRMCNALAIPHTNYIAYGASGKTVVARFAASILGYAYFELMSHSHYSQAMLQSDLLQVYLHVLRHRQPVILRVAERDITSIELIASLVMTTQSPHFISNLFDVASKEQLINIVTSTDPAALVEASTDSAWGMIQSRVRRYIHLVFCVASPASLEHWYLTFPSFFTSMPIDYYHAWDEAALVAIATSSLSGSSVFENISYGTYAEVMARIHIAAKSRGHSAVSARTFLDLIQQYEALMKTQAATMDTSASRMKGGLSKIYEAEARIATLRAQLERDLTEAAMLRSECERLLTSIGEEKHILEERQRKAKFEAEAVKEHVERVHLHKQECESDLQKMQPVIRAAINALDKLDRFHLIELRSLPHPPEDVVRVTSALLVLTSNPDNIPKKNKRDWAASRRMMSTNVIHWLKTLRDYDKDNIDDRIVDAVKEYVLSPGFTPDNIRTKSFAAAGLCEWLLNIYSYHRLRCVVRPKEEALASAQEKLQVSEEELERANKFVCELEAKHADTMARHATAEARLREVLESVEVTSKKANVAERLIQSLEEEKSRWNFTIDSLASRQMVAPGDALLAAAFVAYFGPFSKPTRDGLLDLWKAEMLTNQVAFSTDLNITQSILSNEIEALKWAEEGLARDMASNDNAAILKHCNRVPLIYDPENLCMAYLSGKHKDRMVTARVSHNTLVDTVTHCAETGKVCIITRVTQFLTPALASILTARCMRRDGHLRMVIGDADVFVRDGYHLVLHTTVPLPIFPRRFGDLCSPIDFSISPPALREQLLAHTLHFERPELQAQREEVTKLIADQQRDLQGCENDLLEILASATGDVLSNVALIDNLEQTKQRSLSIMKAIELAKQSERDVEASCETYRSFASLSCALYFHLQELRNVEYSYQFSLDSFLAYFNKGLTLTSSGATPVERAHLLLTSVPRYLIRRVFISLLPKDRLMLCVLLVLSLMEANKEVPRISIDFLLNAPQRRLTPRPSCVAGYCSEIAWYRLCALTDTAGSCEEHQQFATLTRDFAEAVRWKHWVETEAPETELLPYEWRSLTPFSKLLIVRCLRPDRVLPALESMVKEKLGAGVLDDVMPDMRALVSEAAPSQPIFFLLTAGADPTHSIESIARENGRTDEAKTFVTISMGQGQEAKAASAITQGAVNGWWCLLSNIHLVPQWLPTLEAHIAAFGDASTVHKDFRLFLTSEPCSDVPVPVLQYAIKVTTEPPRGVRQNILMAAQRIPEDAFATLGKSMELAYVVSCVTFLHAVLIERAKFGKAGWNSTYNFNDEDILATASILCSQAEQQRRIAWDGLRFLIGDIIYGGHITDVWDQRLCAAYTARFLSPGHREGSELCTNYTTRVARTRAEFETVVHRSKFSEGPALFGLHPSASVTHNALLADSLLGTAGEVFFTTRASTTQWSAHETVLHRIETDILPNLCSLTSEEVMDALTAPVCNESDRIFETGHIGPPPAATTYTPPTKHLHLPTASETPPRSRPRTPNNVGPSPPSAPSRLPNTFNVSLRYEVDVFERVMRRVHNDLEEVRGALLGSIGMSPTTEAINHCIYTDAVPAEWSRLSPHTAHMSLTQWLLNLSRRQSQLRSWIEEQRPLEITNLALMYNPVTFLTCLQRETAKRYGAHVDEMVLDIAAGNNSGIPDNEIYVVTGIVLSGARIDDITWNLDDPPARMAMHTLGPVPLCAVAATKNDRKDYYECPVYASPSRTETLFSLGLSTSVPPIKWVIAGVAMYVDDR